MLGNHGRDVEKELAACCSTLLPGYQLGQFPPEVRLAIALRFLAGGQILDLRMCYHVVKSDCYRSVWCVVDGVNGCAALQAEFPMCDTDKLRARGRVPRQVRGQVLAVDGVHFENLTPAPLSRIPSSTT